ncbi:MAG: plasmid recombination protein [Bacteroides sp.]|nr:plasmid recombination protein [Bacteroides sp.]
MGYAVLHLEKAKGADGGMSAHIERTIHPANADKTRTHLNRELISFPEGVKNRTQAITHRLETAGITRKIGTNQVRAIRVLMTGTNEDMKRLEASGQLDSWCRDNLKWLYESYGEKNVVSAVLHMDEKTPHVHATVVPIVTGERRKAKQQQQDGKKKYRKKSSQSARLCADDVMARSKLKHYQNTYAEVMNKYGLQRGIDGSEAKHISTADFYKEMINQQVSIQEDIENLLEQKEVAQQQLKQVKSEINTQKLKGAAVNATTAIADGVSSLFGSGKVKKLEEENEQLKENVSELSRQITIVQKEKKKSEMRLYNDMDVLNKKHQEEITQSNNRLEQIDTYFPYIKVLMLLAIQCRELGFTEEMTRQLVNLQPVEFKGSLYSKEYGQKFKTEHSTAIIERSSEKKGKFHLCIDGMPILEWFKKKFQEIKEKVGIIPRVENKPNRGFKM